MPTIAGAIRDAMQAAVSGERVLLCAPTQKVVRSYFLALMGTDELQALGASARHTVGRERITFRGGGRIDFQTTGGTGVRGYTAEAASDDTVATALPVLAGTGGELVRYTR